MEESQNPDNASSIASDDDIESAPLLRATTTNDASYPSEAAEFADGTFAVDSPDLERGAEGHDSAGPKKRWSLKKKIAVGVGAAVILLIFIRLIVPSRRKLVSSEALQEDINSKNLLQRANHLFELAELSIDEYGHPTRVIGSKGNFSFIRLVIQYACLYI